MNTLSVICENIVEAVPEVVKWNSWDGEHLRTVHGAYDIPQNLVTRNRESLFVDRFKIPFIGCRIKTMVFTTQWDENRQVSFSLTPFFLAKNTIEVIPLEDKLTLVRVTYEFQGNKFQSLLFPIIRKMIQRWNSQVWSEDLPLKLRRQKALEYGFIDFKGIPKKLSDRKDISLEYKAIIPGVRVRGIIEDRHPFALQSISSSKL